MVFECLVFLVICHAENAKPGFLVIETTSVNNELGHVRYDACVGIDSMSKANGFRDVMTTVHQPETRRDRRGKLDAVVNDNQWCRASDIFPLSRSGTPCDKENIPSNVLKSKKLTYN